VLTRNKDWTNSGVEIAHSLEQAYEMAAKADYKEVYIIGGADIYAQALTHAQTVYLTRVEVTMEGDSFSPSWDKNGSLWEMNPM